MTGGDGDDVIRREWFDHPVPSDATGEVVVGVDHGDQASTGCLVVMSVDGRGHRRGHRPVLVIVDDPSDGPDPDAEDRLREVLERWVEACDGLRLAFQELGRTTRVALDELDTLLGQLQAPELRLPDEVQAELDAMLRRLESDATDWPEPEPLRRPPTPWPEQPLQASAWRPAPVTHHRPRRGPWTLPWTPA